jgi:hypothetical protein
MITQRVIDLDTLINSAIPQSKTPEYLVSTQAIDEEVDGISVRMFPVPRTKFFSVHEVVYLAAALSTDMDTIKRRIDELKLGRKTIQKLYAVRLDGEPWSTKPLTLPILCDREKDEGCFNEVEVEPAELRGSMVYAIYVLVNGVRFLKITTLKYPGHYEINITRLAGYKGIARYIVNTKLTP